MARKLQRTRRRIGWSRTAGLAAVGLGAAVLAAGCEPDAPARTAAGPRGGNAPAAAPPGPTFDPRLVDPKYESACAEYSRDIRTLAWDASDNEIRRSLRMLSIAAERVPYAGSVDLAGAAARVRGGRERPGAPGPGASAPSVDGPLGQLAGAFVDLAKGPYREGVGVLAAAYGFQQAVKAMTSPRAPEGERRRAAFDVLGRGEAVLYAIRGAVGRGEVGLGGEAPPPVDFEP